MNPNLLAASLFSGATLVVFVLLSVVAFVYRRLRPAGRGAADADGRTLARAVAAARPPRTWQGRFDRSFDRMLRWTLVGLTSQQALGIILLSGVAVAALFFAIWGEWWGAALGFFAGMVVPVAVLWMLQRRWRLAVQEQLPDGLFLLARSLRRPEPGTGDRRHSALLPQAARRGLRPVRGPD